MDSYEEARLLYLDAKLAFSENRYDDAIRLLQKSASQHSHFKTHELLGCCLIETGDVDGAFGALEEAYQQSSRSDKTACLLAQCCIHRGDTARARKILESVLSRNTGYGPATTLMSKLELLAHESRRG